MKFMMQKLINFRDYDLVMKIDDYAKEHTSCNFTKAIMELLKAGIEAKKEAE